jgi:GT2 family glycosyltransferase
MNVSIIMPLYKPDETLDKALKVLKKQKFGGKIEIIRVEKGWGLAESMNYGIKKAKYDVIVSLHQDCVPGSDEWLSKLVEPLNNDNVVASVSKVELPLQLWKSFDLPSRILTVKESGILQPLMDEKGCAYKKSALLRAGLFDFKTFRTCGEDFDMYFKLKKQGRIAYPDCKILHFHKTYFRKRIRKELQYAEGYGTLFSIYKKQMPGWWRAMLKAIPLVGALVIFASINRKNIKYFWLWFFLSFLLNITYMRGFWPGFLRKKQRI